VANNDDFMRFLASWALVHESADEGWKSAVTRGETQEPGEMNGGPEAFVDGLSAMIAERKEQLKAELASGGAEPGASRADVGGHLDELRFEVAELRGRLESMQASLDAVLERGSWGAAGGSPASSAPSAAAAQPAPKPAADPGAESDTEPAAEPAAETE